MIEALQILSIETDHRCNLAGQHAACPASLGPGRYTALPSHVRLMDLDIVALVAALRHRHGFAGWVNLSFYNEPLVHADRLFRVAARLAGDGARLMLHTNGMLLPEDAEPFRPFDVIWVTDYGGAHAPDPARLDALRAVCGEGVWPAGGRPHGVIVTKGRLDGRMQGPHSERSNRPCRLPLKDWPIDACGNAHLCCLEWRGAVPLGNVLLDGIEPVLARWIDTVRQIAGPTMTPAASSGCRHCRFAGFQRVPVLDPVLAARAVAWYKGEPDA